MLTNVMLLEVGHLKAALTFSASAILLPAPVYDVNVNCGVLLYCFKNCEVCCILYEALFKVTFKTSEI